MIISIHVIPGSSQNQYQGLKDGTVCIKLTAPPVDGAANAALIKFLSKSLKINKSHIKLISGEKSRDKKVQIDGLELEEICKKLEK